MRQEMIDSFVEFSQSKIQQGEGVHGEIVHTAKQNVEGFKSLRSSILAEMQIVLEKIVCIEGKVKANVRSEANPDGLLHHGEEAYLKCLKVRHSELESIFKKDEAIWQASLEAAKLEAKKINQEVQEFFQRSQKELQSLLMRENMVKTQFSLQKLPMWGLQESQNIDFEWPTTKEFQTMEPDVSLKSLEFMMSCPATTAVRCTLSNGMSSPLFTGENWDKNNPMTLDFSSVPMIRSVAATEYIDKAGNYYYSYKMRFLDACGGEVCAYNPMSHSSECREITLAENEQLIGVYGIKGGPQKWIKALGFIVKVKTTSF